MRFSADYNLFSSPFLAAHMFIKCSAELPSSTQTSKERYPFFAETPSASQTAPVPSPSPESLPGDRSRRVLLVRNLLLSLRAVRHEPVYLSILIGNDQKLFVLRHIGKLTAPAFYPIRKETNFLKAIIHDPLIRRFPAVHMDVSDASASCSFACLICMNFLYLLPIS